MKRLKRQKCIKYKITESRINERYTANLYKTNANNRLRSHSLFLPNILLLLANLVGATVGDLSTAVAAETWVVLRST